VETTSGMGVDWLRKRHSEAQTEPRDTEKKATPKLREPAWSALPLKRKRSLPHDAATMVAQKQQPRRILPSERLKERRTDILARLGRRFHDAGRQQQKPDALHLTYGMRLLRQGDSGPTEGSERSFAPRRDVPQGSPACPLCLRLRPN